MKTRIILCFSILIMSNTFSHSQSLSKNEIIQFANKLVEKRILNEKGKAGLINDIEFDIERVVTMTDPPKAETLKTKKEKVTKEDVLQYCANAFAREFAYRNIGKNWKIERDIKPEDSTKDGWTVYSFPLKLMAENLIHGSRSTIGSTRTRTLNDFLELGLINSWVYDNAKQKILELTINTEVELLKYLYDQQVFYNQYDELKAKQLEFMRTLFEKGMMSADVYKSVINSYKSYEIKTKQEILSHCKSALRFDLSNFSEDPTITYPSIFDSIKKIIKDFNFTSLTVKKSEKPVSDLIEETVQISFIVDTIKYSHKFFHDYKKAIPDQEPVRAPAKISSEFHRGINKYLTDLGSEYRLHFIIFPDESSVYGQKEFGLILLTKDEEEITNNQFDFSLTNEIYDDALSTQKIRSFINELNEQGFFKHLSHKEYEEGIEKIKNSDIRAHEHILGCFPKTLVVFDWETGNLENPYEDLLKQFAEASRGAFSVSNIVDEYKKGWKKAKEIKFGFTLNNKRYEKQLRFKGDWLAPEFLELIKKALKENNINGDIFYCLDNGQESGYIFLSTSQLNFIQTNYPQILKN